MRGFRDLAVYERASALADQLRSAVARWPSFDKWSIGLQMLRAADSVGANIAEGSGRYGAPDHRRLLFIARGSACELQHWIERARARSLGVPEGALGEAVEVTRMLNGLIRNLPDHSPND
jgi:four helix bundle protein